MGMYDNFNSTHPLCAGEYQTTSLECTLEQYELRADGVLYIERYDIEDQSDPNAEGFARLHGSMTRVNQRMEATDYTGEVVFYHYTDDGSNKEFSAYFINGKLRILIDTVADKVLLE